MRILIAVVGSLGDVLPFVAMGVELKRRGHEVRVYANPTFSGVIEAAGLAAVGVGSAARHQAFLDSPEATDPKKAMALVAAGVMSNVPLFYDAMYADIIPGETTVIGSTMAFASRLLREKCGLPGAVVHLSPSVIRSEFMAPRFSPLGHMEKLPRCVKRFVWRTLDRKFLDPLYGVPFNRLRAGLGLAPVDRIMHQWLHEGELCIGLYPRWFAAPQPDAPANFHPTAFPLFDGGERVGDKLAAFFDDGAAPVAFTSGTANATSHSFYAASAEACRLSGKRGILITPHKAQVPATLPQGVVQVDSVSFQALLPRVAAFVHHGGIGSTSQALAAGVPQLIQPMAFDQFDNASRAVRLGVARSIAPKRYTASAVADQLNRLTSDQALAARCKAVAAMTAASAGVDEACDLVERILAGVNPTPVTRTAS
ncbi:glycosyltransferase [Massilia antarctica]|uniref:Glycosyltransferase n=1 Tax=Massilia antarctica TaxID=2765360 RepID=A0AA49A6B4_9BURK|nr:nucleotide disphospho-sugar-binding domain-containing protein [Massilia antarctica]QPI47971.1 glycosyltransferase [Massilia antarctica]